MKKYNDITYMNIETIIKHLFALLVSKLPIDTAIQKYIDYLYQSTNPYFLTIANKLNDYLQFKEKCNSSLIDELFFSDFEKYLNTWKAVKKYDFHIYVECRLKAFIKFFKKLILYLTSFIEADISEKGKYSFDHIYDILAMRLILYLGSIDTSKSIEILYEFLNEVINFYLKKGFTLKSVNLLNNSDFNSKEHPDVFVPTFSGVPDAFINNVKDYYSFPKLNGYQSLHLVLMSPSGLYIEIQICTLATHTRIDCTHCDHDLSKYAKNVFCNEIDAFDLQKINISGFNYDKTKDELDDNIGMLKPITVFKKII